MQINLIEEKEKIGYIFYLFLGVLIFLIIVFSAFYFSKYRILIDLNKELALIEEKLNSYMPHQQEFKKIKSDLQLLKENRVNLKWGEAVAELGYTAPEGLILTGYYVNRKQIKIKGMAKSERVMMLFVNNLRLSPIFNEIQPVDITRQEYLEFEIKGYLVKENSNE